MMLLQLTAVFSLLAPLAQPSVGNPNQFNNFLVLGYFLMWLIGILYVASLANRQRHIEKDIELMKQILQEDEDTPKR